MFKIMAMEHVNTFLLKLYSYFHCLLLFYRTCVPPSWCIFRWCLPGPAAHFTWCAMKMPWLTQPPHVIRLVVHTPYLGFPLSSREGDSTGTRRRPRRR